MPQIETREKEILPIRVLCKRRIATKKRDKIEARNVKNNRPSTGASRVPPRCDTDFQFGSGSVSIFYSFLNHPRSVILRPQAEESHGMIDGWRDSSSALRSDSEWHLPTFSSQIEPLPKIGWSIPKSARQGSGFSQLCKKQVPNGGKIMGFFAA